jgi:uncharacterized protein (DUF2236 family)
VAEMTAAAELVGIPPGRAPSTIAELNDYFSAVRPVLTLSPAAAESTRYLLDLPWLDEEMGGLWRDLGDAAVAALPEWAARLYGLVPTEPVTAQRRAEVRQLLGVLDVLYLGEPGVLEARQRLELRMRLAAAR